MAWRRARSLDVLAAEIQAVAPGTTVWDIGDANHGENSDHSPNADDVVCAIDVLGNAGLDLGEFAETVRTGGHPAGKYVIFNRRIASRSQGWTWRSYHGSNPHTGHVHVSVGRGPDGKSTGPYDDTSPWGLADTGGVMALPRAGDQGDEVEVIQRMLVAVGFDTIDPDDPEHDPEWRYDGDYGGLTEAAVRAFRQSINPNLDSGARVTPWTFYRLIRAVGALDGGEQGPPGPPGERGRQGEPGRTPTKIAISGDVIEVA